MHPPLNVPEPAAAVEPARVLGGRWALVLASALLTLFALITGLRWADHSSRSGSEEIVQQPVVNVPPSPRQEPSAPDPGDNP